MLWTRRFPFWLRYCHCLRFCGSVAAMSWWNTYGHGFLSPPASWTLKCAGRWKKSWSVSKSVLYDIRIVSGKLRMCSKFSLLFFCSQFCWMGCSLESQHVLWAGPNHVANSVWSCKRGQKPLLFSHGHETGTRSVKCVWLSRASIVERLKVKSLFLGILWVLLVPQCRLLPLLGDDTCFATLTLSLLAVGTGRSWSSTPSLTCGY